MSDSVSPKPHPFEAAYRGAASIALGAAPLILMHPTIQLAGWLYSFVSPGPSVYSGHALVVLGFIVAVALFFGMGLFGIREGLRGWSAARHTGEPRVLCRCGIVFSFLTVVGWLLIAFWVVANIGSAIR